METIKADQEKLFTIDYRLFNFSQFGRWSKNLTGYGCLETETIITTPEINKLFNLPDNCKSMDLVAYVKKQQHTQEIEEIENGTSPQWKEKDSDKLLPPGLEELFIKFKEKLPKNFHIGCEIEG